MKGRHFVIIFVAVFVVIYLAVFLTAPDEVESVDTTVSETEEVSEAAQSTPEPEPTPDETLLLVQDFPQQTPEPTATPDPDLPPELAALRPDDDQQMYYAGGAIAELIDRYGVLPVYGRLAIPNRQVMLDHLFFNQEARDYAIPLLAMEDEVWLRLNLIESLEPTYVFDPNDEWDPNRIDNDFLKILDAPVKNGMDPEEWTSRLVLAGLVSDVAALDYSRKAPDLFPNDPEVNTVASSHMLLFESDRAVLSPAERQEASDNLAQLVTGESWISGVKNDYRLNGYRAIAGFSDTERARMLLEAAVAKETDNRLKLELDQLIGDL